MSTANALKESSPQKKQRKRNWNAGMTRMQHKIASAVQTAHIWAFEREHKAGTLGAPGSVWEIGPDGLAQCRAHDCKIIAAALTDPNSNVVGLISPTLVVKRPDANAVQMPTKRTATVTIRVTVT
jgi:hypothetical protein